MQLMGDEGDGNDEGWISAADEDALYCGDDYDSLYADGYGQRDELYCGGGRDWYRAEKSDYAPSSSEVKMRTSNS